MKQKTRHHVQRVAAGILASILTLSGIGAAHATSSHEPGHGVSEVNVPVSFSVKVEAQTPLLATEQRTNPIQYELTPTAF